MSNNKINLTVKINGNLNKVTIDAEQFSKALRQVIKDAGDLNSNSVNFAALSQGINSACDAVSKLSSGIKNLTATFAAQESAETKLAQVMRNTMGASDEEVASIKALASAQQELGVVGDEVQLAGAQELATYLGLSSSLETLLPVMNDMIAQQYGLNATQESAAQIATMMGKVMEGQTAALSRYGYSFTEAQEKILKFGTEEQKAATLAAVVEQSVGGVNAALAQTSSGQMAQAANTIGDVKESIGAVLVGIEPMISKFTEVGQAVSSITIVTEAIKAMSASVKTGAVSFATWTKKVLANKVVLVAHAVQQKVCSAATKAWTAIQTIFNAVMTMNPIGIVVTAIGALVAAIVVAYKKCEGFRNVVNQVFQVLKKVASIVYGPVIKAFKTVCGWISKAWELLKKFLGITDDGKVEMKVEVEDNTDTLDFDSIASTIQEPDKKDANKNKDVSYMVGSEKYLENLIQQKQLEKESINDLTRKAQLINEIADLQEQLNKKQLEATAASQGMSVVEYTTHLASESIAEEMEKDALNLDEVIDVEPLVKDLQVVRTEIKKTVKQGEAFSAMGELMRNVGGAVQGTAQAWLDYGANVLTAIGQAIPAIMKMIAINASATASERAKKNEQVGSAAAGAMSAYSEIPFVGIVLGLAAVASIIAAMRSVPKFANGGIAYGPTLGLFGEYAGATNNPEVVAPLNKLKSLIGDANGGGGNVQFRIQGRDLVGVLTTENNIMKRR